MSDTTGQDAYAIAAALAIAMKCSISCRKKSEQISTKKS